MPVEQITPDREQIASVEEIIEEARNGRMFILVDAEERENEGDLIIPAQMATPEAINFMAKYGRGLICLAMDKKRAQELTLDYMSPRNQSRHQTAFTISIEAREGISTGISAHDRAHTIAVAIDPSKGADDIVSPGHVFPVIAREGGVLVRAGHTEAVVDIARLAGLYPAAAICEIMNDDGTMARLPDLLGFAQLHGLKIGTIADLIGYRRMHDHFIDRVMECPFETSFGSGFQMVIYQNKADLAEHIALIKGDISSPKPVLVRMHAVNVLNDLLGAETDKTHLIGASIRAIEAEGRGVIVLIRESNPKSVSQRLLLKQQDQNAPNEGKERILREYGVGAQILLNLGVKQMELLTNSKPQTVVGLEGYGLNITGYRKINDGA